jgi:uncharacterized protein (DUF433 family)
MKYLQSNPGIARGELAIIGTRIRIAHIFRMLAAGQTIEEMLEGWPWLAEETLRGAIDEAIVQMEASPASATTHA